MKRRKCDVCGKNIPQARLSALPGTTTCVKCSDVQVPLGVIESSGEGEGCELVLLPDNDESRRWVAECGRRYTAIS